MKVSPPLSLLNMQILSSQYPCRSSAFLCCPSALSVWTSSDSGTSWQALNIHSPWPQRDAFNGEITKDGVIVISSGLGDKDIGLASEAPLNDVSAYIYDNPAAVRTQSQPMLFLLLIPFFPIAVIVIVDGFR